MAPSSSSSRRGATWSSAAAAGELSRPRNRWQAVVLQVKGRRRTSLDALFGFRHIREQEFMGRLPPVLASMVQRVVAEEMEKAFRQINTLAPPRLLVGWNQRPRYQLVFLNGLKTAYTMSKLESEEGAAIKVAIVETLGNNQTKIVRSGHLSSAKVEVVALHGHFNAKNEESWTPEEFNRHRVSGREKSGQLLVGNLTLKLDEGVAILENATFTDNSSFTSTKMFRLGVRLLNASGERILEGVTKPFRVKERRVEGFEKHHPPMPDDEVWRLEKIRKAGPYHLALSNAGIDSVQKLLQAYMMDEQKLMKIFSKKMVQSTWKSIIGHAMTCIFGDTLYLYEAKDQDVGLFFYAIYKPVGVKFGNCYKPIDQLDEEEKNLADSLKRAAYHNMGDLQCNYKMVNKKPVLQRFPAHQGASISPVLPNGQISNNAHHNSYLGDTSNASRQIRENFVTSPGTSNVEVDMTRFVQGQTFHHAQWRHEPIADRVLHYNSSHGALLPGSRMTQLQIPQMEATHFGPDGSSTAVPCNFLVSQVGESYSCPSRDTSSTNDVMSCVQSQFPLPRNSESFSCHSIQQCNDESVMLSQQAVTGFEPSRTNSFDLSCDEIIQSFMSQISNNEGAPTPLSPRKWVKIRAALKLASMGKHSKTRGLYCAPPRPSLVQTI